jgi:hypothetical protein
MKQYLLSILFLVSLTCNVGFGQDCVADLSAQKADLEKVITQIDDEFEDKGKLKDLPNLFKSCVSKAELGNIKKTYLSLKFDASQQQTYKTIIKKILDENKLLCVNFNNNTQQGINKDYIADIDALLKDYESLKEKNEKANTYKGTPTENNYTVFHKIKPLLSDCVYGAVLKEIQDLNNSIATENFGSVTTTFNANLKDIININSDLLSSENTAITIIEDTTENPVVEEIEEVEPKKSSLGTYILYTLLLLSILANGYFLYEKFVAKQKEKETQNPINKTTSKNNGESILRTQKLEKLGKDNEEFRKKNGKLESELKDAKDEIQRLKQKIEDMEQANKPVPVIKSSTSRPKDDNKKNKSSNRDNYEKVLFFASPTLNGEFLEKNGQSEAKSGASIYIFYVNGSEATFKFYNDPSTFRATINDPGNRIKPVCDAVNAYNPDATKIETIQKGEAILDGDKWVVKNNAKIKYL